MEICSVTMIKRASSSSNNVVGLTACMIWQEFLCLYFILFQFIVALFQFNFAYPSDCHFLVQMLTDRDVILRSETGGGYLWSEVLLAQLHPEILQFFSLYGVILELNSVGPLIGWIAGLSNHCIYSSSNSLVIEDWAIKWTGDHKTGNWWHAWWDGSRRSNSRLVC